MMIRNLALALLILPLAACGGGGDAANNASAAEATVTTEPVPAEATRDAENSVVPLPPAAPTPSPVAATAFPEAFRGRWALVPNDCDPAQAAAAKGLMTVEANRIGFYESRATPTRIAIVSPVTLTADLAFTGEGQEWTRRARLTLVDAGRTLVRETADDPEPPMRNLRYSRCPA